MIPSDIDDDDPQVLRSWATEPDFYRCPMPPLDGKTFSPYQHAGVEYCIARDHAIIGDEPGVGKTAQGIGISNAIRAKKTLAIVPASLRLNWEREVWTWSDRENVHTYPVMKASDGVSNKADWVIISYDLLNNGAIFDAIREQRWDHLILDEAHAIKDPKGNKRSTAICSDLNGIKLSCGRFTLLTGTLTPNQPIEAYQALRLVNWDAIDRASLESFRKFYYAEGGGMVRSPVQEVNEKTGQVYTVSKLHWSDKVRNQPRNLDDLHNRLRKHVMTRRLKSQVLKDLPAKRWHPFPIAITADIKRALSRPEWKAAERLYEMNPEAFHQAVPVDGAISTARLELGLAKTPSVLEYIEQLLEEGIEKLLVGAWHHEVLTIMREKLDKYGVAYMDGRTGHRTKQAEVDRFQDDGRCRIMLGQMIPLGKGWTLTAAQDAVLAEPYWVPGENDQFLDRLHRRGQLGSVTGHIPVVPGTLDEKILGTAIAKDKHINATLDGGRRS